MTQAQVKKPSARKSLFLFTNILEVKNKTATHQVGDAKSKREAMKLGTIPWALEQKPQESLKINEQIKKYLYN